MTAPNPTPPACPDGQITGQPDGIAALAGRRIAYGCRVGFSVPAPGVTPQVGVFGWALDLDRFEPAGVLCLTDQTGAQHRLGATARRSDLLRKLSVPREKHASAVISGFSGQFPCADRQTTITLELDGEVHRIGTAKPAPARLLSGAHGWLFLAGDSNDSPAQFTGNFRPSKAWSDGWTGYFNALEALRDSGAAGKAAFLIAPSKETIFRDFYPLKRGNQTPLEALWRMIADRSGVCYPVDLLVSLRELAYDRVETHWTDFGARIVCEKLFGDWGISVPGLPFHMQMAWETGDLGWAAAPPVRTWRPIAAWPNPSRVIFDNKVLHHGRIRVTANPAPLIPETCVIFGGSSGEHMARYLTAVFARVVYVYSAGAWDAEILAHERPSFTVMQSAERFLIRPPRPQVDSRLIVADKVARGQVIDATTREALLAGWTDPSIALYKQMG